MKNFTRAVTTATRLSQIGFIENMTEKEHILIAEIIATVMEGGDCLNPQYIKTSGDQIISYCGKCKLCCLHNS